jgi:hypothetical protein
MEDFIIATDPDFTVRDYQDALERGSKQDKDYIADAMERRFLNRYIVPGEAEGYKNGFNIMANCCLLIETLESFYRGWSKSPNSSLAFCNFLTESLNSANLPVMICQMNFIGISGVEFYTKEKLLEGGELEEIKRLS